MRRITCTLLGVGLLAFAAGAAEEKPNFTGTWQQNSQKSSPPGPAGTIRIDTIDHQDPYVGVSVRTSFVNPRLGGGVSSSWTYRTDGKEQAITLGWITASWQGPTLVFQKVEKRGSDVTATRETWTLSDEGKTLTKTRRAVSSEGVSHQTLVFEKQ